MGSTSSKHNGKIIFYHVSLAFFMICYLTALCVQDCVDEQNSHSQKTTSVLEQGCQVSIALLKNDLLLALTSLAKPNCLKFEEFKDSFWLRFMMQSKHLSLVSLPDDTICSTCHIFSTLHIVLTNFLILAAKFGS